MKRVLFAMLVLSVCVGCGPSAPPAKDSGTAGQAATGVPAKEAGGYEIGVVPKGLSHQFWLTVRAGADAAGKDLNAKIIWQGPAQESEIDKQINIVEDLINSKVDAIVMAACDENALIATVQKAMNAGIPVVTIDSGVKSELPVSFVATDNVAAAKAAARELARLVGNEGEVGLIPFIPGAATSEMREQGFKEGIAEFPNVKLVSTLYCQSDAALGMNVTQDMMTSNPNLKGIFVANEPGAVGSAQAVKAAGKAGVVKLVAFDGSDQEIAHLKDGVIQALVVQNPFRMGYEGVKTAIDHIQGKPVEKRVDTGVTVVTMENFNQPEIQKLLYPLGQK